MVGGILKSLFKSGARDVKEKFSKPGEDEELDTPLNLRIGAAVDIDTLSFRIHQDDLHLKMPEVTLLVAAQGYVDLGDDSYLHRFYGGDNTMIQVMTVDGAEDQHVEEITLYMPYQSYYPSNDAEWAQWLANGGKFGALKYTMEDGTEYDRLWFDTTPGHAEPVQFTEYIYEDPESDNCREQFQKAMLFGRNLQADKKNEYLLLTVESYDDEETVELYVGVDIELSQIKVI